MDDDWGYSYDIGHCDVECQLKMKNRFAVRNFLDRGQKNWGDSGINHQPGTVHLKLFASACHCEM